MRLTARHGRLALTLRVLRMGRDLQVICSGGQAHIGAVAVASPQPARAQEAESRVQNLISLPGHREDMLAARMARHLADALDCTVCVSAGIHFDCITKEEIERVLNLAATLTDRCVTRLRQPAKDCHVDR
ncbi:hypothetical protein [Desulfovibrio sp.]|uniref:prenylated flavin chaperone LpdD n=1 Tax=Desulfovibrio sp. TaxID=885 RepID=UPI0025BBBFA2|nr:hypothetical protein [Desulfovibrio sp.]